MTHTYSEEFIPLGDAFEQAFLAMENCEELLKGSLILPDFKSEASADQRDCIITKYHHYDNARRRVERPMRDALADGGLLAFIKAPNGQMELLVDRESWRRESFGVPGIENVPHDLTNPGPHTRGQPVFLSTSNFQEWLTKHRHAIDPFRTGGPGKPSAIGFVKHEHLRRLGAGEALQKVNHEADHLKRWLDSKYPEAPKTSKKTIENSIREAHRKRPA